MAVREIFKKELYDKDCRTKFWDGYRGEKVVLVDNFYPKFAKEVANSMSYNWKKWVENFNYQEFLSNQNFIYPKYKCIIFISHESIEQVFKDDTLINECFNSKFLSFHLKEKNQFEDLNYFIKRNCKNLINNNINNNY